MLGSLNTSSKSLDLQYNYPEESYWNGIINGSFLNTRGFALSSAPNIDTQTKLPSLALFLEGLGNHFKNQSSNSCSAIGILETTMPPFRMSSPHTLIDVTLKPFFCVFLFFDYHFYILTR